MFNSTPFNNSTFNDDAVEFSVHQISGTESVANGDSRLAVLTSFYMEFITDFAEFTASVTNGASRSAVMVLAKTASKIKASVREIKASFRVDQSE